MAPNTPRLTLRAVITEAGGEFIVSVTLLSPEEDPTIVGEEIVATLDAADLYVEQLSRKMGYTDKVEKMYALSSGIFSRRPQTPHKRASNKTQKKSPARKK